jgi:hypothetical protein
VGVNLAVNGSDNGLSYFFRNEYIRSFSRLFEGGIGLGFFNSQNSPMTITYWNGHNNKVYNTFTQTSIVSLDIMGYIDIVNTRRSLLRFGVGYSIRYDKTLFPYHTYPVKNSVGEFLYTTDYTKKNGIDSGIIIHLSYGYHITSHFTTALSMRYYNEGRYVSLSMIGLDFSYSF